MVRIIALLTALVVPMTVACADDKVEAKPDKANERTVILQLTHVTGGTGTGLPGGDPTHGRREFLRSALEDATGPVRPLPEMQEPGLYPFAERNYAEVRVAQATGATTGRGAFGGGGGAQGGGALAQLLPEGLTEKPVALADQNALILKGTAEAIDEFAEIVSLLDKPVQQVNIEVRLVTMSRRLDQGWGYDLPIRGRDLQIDVVGPAPPAGSNLRFKTGNMAPLISGTNRESLSNNTTGANITTKNNRMCVIRATTLIPFVAASVSYNQFGQRTVDYAIDAVATGVELFCLPRINADDSISMMLDPRFIAPTGEVVAPDGTVIPITEEISLQSEVVVQDGETLALGGFPRSIETLETVGLPLNFKRSELVEDAESILFVTPRIIRNLGM